MQHELHHDDRTALSIIEIFTSVLQAEAGEILADTDFFDAGGNSITAARAVARIRQACGVPVSIRDIFTGSTPALLAERVAALAARSTAGSG